MSDIYKNGAKNNPNIEKAIMTGIMRFSKADIFSGMNNFSEFNVINDNEFSQYFGFTQEDINYLI